MRALASRRTTRTVIRTGVGVAVLLAVLLASGADTAPVAQPVTRIASGHLASPVTGGPTMIPAARRVASPAASSPALSSPAARSPASSPPAIAAAGSGPAVSPARGGHRQRVDHSNVGAAHSPKLLRQLAMAPPPSRGNAPGGHARRGVDVAAYQHPDGKPIDWRRVGRAGIQFAAVKATEGTYYRNPFALSDLAQARAAGLSVMAYAFAIPNGNGGSSSPVAQADFLIDYLTSAGGPVPPIMLDIEYNPYGANCYGLSPAAMVSWIARFSDEVQARTGGDPIIYGPVPWWQECAGGTSQFGQFPLWVPDYTSAPRPELTSGWANWAFWQYSSDGTVTGIDAPGHTDLDVLNTAVIPLLDRRAQAATVGGAVDLQFRPADLVAGQALSFSARGLPAGVTVNAAGEVTGWPEAAGNYHPTVKVADRKGQSGSVSFAWPVHPAPSTGATGMIQLGLTGRCLAAAAGGSGDGTRAEAGTCTGSSAQDWTYVQDNTLRIGNQCLTLPAAAKGVAAGLEPCTGTAAQQWHMVYPRALNPALGPGHTTLVNPGTGMCVAGPGLKPAGKTAAVLWPCTGEPDESWTLPPGPMTSGIPGLCLDDRRDQTANNTVVDLWKCNGTAAQAWQAEPDGTVRVNGKCLNVSGGATARGSPADLYSCNGTPAQIWDLVPEGDGVTLMNPASGRCLADPGDALAKGTQAVIAACAAGDPGMSWRPS